MVVPVTELLPVTMADEVAIVAGFPWVVGLLVLKDALLVSHKSLNLQVIINLYFQVSRLK